jgi:putative flavoprotein involved in K+ transport
MQLHVDGYRNPGDLQDGPMLVVGAGNSGAEVARESADQALHLSILAISSY